METFRLPVLLFGVTVSLVCLAASLAQGQCGTERAVEARPRPAADRQNAGTFDRLAGEYRGTSDGVAFVVWVDVSPPVEEGQQAALLLFREQDRPRLEAYIKRIIANPPTNTARSANGPGPGNEKVASMTCTGCGIRRAGWFSYTIFRKFACLPIGRRLKAGITLPICAIRSMLSGKSRNTRSEESADPPGPEPSKACS